MNERIQELAGQAWNMVEDTNKPLLFAEKFAELIVRDCISTVEGMDPGYNDSEYNGIEDAFRRDCVAKIKHQFGVE